MARNFAKGPPTRRCDVLEGRVRFEETWYEAGFYLNSPPGSADDVFTDTGAILFVALPKPHADLE